jgi:hydrogenase nickel incorporation protein HypA/HybF
MHELSLCRSIQNVVEKAAEGRTVEAVHLQVGKLRQVIPETLVYCWGIVTDDTSLSGSTLDVESIPITVTCRDCHHDTGVAHELILVCNSCGSAMVDVTTGEEFLVTSIDVSKENDRGSIPSAR